jgi:hypothetical protein
MKGFANIQKSIIAIDISSLTLADNLYVENASLIILVEKINELLKEIVDNYIANLHTHLRSIIVPNEIIYIINYLKNNKYKTYSFDDHYDFSSEIYNLTYKDGCQEPRRVPDRDDVISNVSTDGTNLLKFLEYINDIDIVTKAIKQNGLALQYASDGLKDNSTIVEEAIKKNGLALQYASDGLKDNSTIVEEAIKQNGLALQYASDGLKNNIDIVTKAIKQNGLALQYGFYELKNNIDIVKQAIEQNYKAIQYASHDVKVNKEILFTLIRKLCIIDTDNTDNTDNVYYICSHGCDTEDILHVPDNCVYITTNLCGMVSNGLSDNHKKFLQLVADRSPIIRNPIKEENIEYLSKEFTNLHIKHKNALNPISRTYVKSYFSMILDYNDDKSKNIVNHKRGTFLQKSGIYKIYNYIQNTIIFKSSNGIQIRDEYITENDVDIIYNQSIYPTPELIKLYIKLPTEFREFCILIQIYFNIYQNDLFKLLPGIYYNLSCRSPCTGNSETPFYPLRRSQSINATTTPPPTPLPPTTPTPTSPTTPTIHNTNL